MKTYLLILSFFVFSISSRAQNFHFNLYAGASNYNGDLQDKRYTFNQSNLAGGFGASYDLTDHFYLRSSLLLGRYLLMINMEETLFGI